MRVGTLGCVAVALVVACGGSDASVAVPAPLVAGTITPTTVAGFNLITGQTTAIGVRVLTTTGAPMPNVLVAFDPVGGGFVANPSSPILYT